MNALYLVAALALCGSLASCLEVPSVPADAGSGREASDTVVAAASTSTVGALSSWPSGPALTIALPSEPTGAVLTKAMFDNGDIVLEQAWPDGTRERWWYQTDGSVRHVSRGQRREDATP